MLLVFCINIKIKWFDYVIKGSGDLKLPSVFNVKKVQKKTLPSLGQ